MIPTEKLSFTFAHRRDIQKAIAAVAAAGIEEYNEPLTVDSTVKGEPINLLSALDEARDEAIDATLYLMVAQQLAYGDSPPKSGFMRSAFIHGRAMITALADARAEAEQAKGSITTASE